jgi:hypothetical protein
MKNFLAWVNSQLAILPSVPVTTIKLALLDAATLAWGVGLSFRKDTNDAVPVFNSWLTALCVLHGTGTTAFGIAKLKGNTNAPMPTDTAEFPAVVPPAPPPPSAVVQTATTTTVTAPPAPVPAPLPHSPRRKP